MDRIPKLDTSSMGIPLSKTVLEIRVALAWLLVFAISPGLAEDNSVFTPDHVAKIRSVGSVEISPDGGFIAYTLRVPRKPFDDEDGPAWAELHVVDRVGKSRPFVTGEVTVSRVLWTPDGKSISFLAKRGKDKETCLYVIPVDGGEARRLVSHDTGISDYSWAPDGKRVAFIATEKESKDKEKLKEKGLKAEVYEEDFKPVRVWVLDTSDTEAKPKALEIKGTPSEIHWSPIDDRIALALAPTPLIDDNYMNRRVHVIDAATGEIKTQVENPGKLGDIEWSPDGKHLALLSGEDIHDPAPGRLIIVPAEGGKLVDVLPGYEGHVTSIDWQDAATVMYLGDEGVWTTLGEVRVDGAQHKVHLPAGKLVLSGLSLTDDGQTAAVIGESPAHPAEVFLSSHEHPAPNRLTDNNAWLADMRLAAQEPVSFTARDGVRVEGLLVRPLQEEAGRRYPLILCVHGGPESHDRNGWLTNYADPGQLGAARGFAVFYPNYRGSTGRGVAYAKSHQADYAGKEFNDLVDAIDHLVSTGLVDGQRVGITGGSYGGFATAWCSTYHTERFAAAVMFVGISDLVSKVGTTDIPNEMYLVHARKQPWEDWTWFRERSPLYYATQCRTPILIMHGKDDTRVHPSQSMELYRYLKVLGQTPVRLVFYPGEGHGNRNAASRLDYCRRMMQWFEHYLQGPCGDPPPYELDYSAYQKDDESEDKAGPTSSQPATAPTPAQ